jgi:hypothetical protein
VTYPIFGRGGAQPPRLSYERPKRRDKELNYKWSRFAESYLRKHPFCAECARHGRDVLASHLDHIIPRRDGGSLWSPANLQPLCNGCEPLKRHLERLAADSGNVQIIVSWIERPETRPGHLAFIPNRQE